mmetsp:Transcript_6777/g.19534  ORF Transcript_6777/g.19534 Transcript_6777/m.19534 type:complete len:569 (+) Transcript_6777:107-1813(+)
MDALRYQKLPPFGGTVVTGGGIHAEPAGACKVAGFPCVPPSTQSNNPTELPAPDWKAGAQDLMSRLAVPGAGFAPSGAGASSSPPAPGTGQDAVFKAWQNAAKAGSRPLSRARQQLQRQMQQKGQQGQASPHSEFSAGRSSTSADLSGTGTPPTLSVLGNDAADATAARAVSPSAGSDCSAGSEQSCLAMTAPSVSVRPAPEQTTAQMRACSPPPHSPTVTQQSAPAWLEQRSRSSFDSSSRDDALSRLNPSLRHSGSLATALPALEPLQPLPSLRTALPLLPAPTPLSLSAGRLCSLPSPAALDSVDLPITPLDMTATTPLHNTTTPMHSALAGTASGLSGGSPCLFTGDNSSLAARLQQQWQWPSSPLFRNSVGAQLDGLPTQAPHTRLPAWASVTGTGARPSLSNHSNSSAFSTFSIRGAPPPFQAPPAAAAAAAALPPLHPQPAQERRAAPRQLAGRRGSSAVNAREGSPLAPVGSGSSSDAGSLEAAAARSIAEARAACRMNRAKAIAKFREKRAQRNFNKKVRYVSRKRLAESRPRVRGQFVKAGSAAAVAAAAAAAAAPTK